MRWQACNHEVRTAGLHTPRVVACKLAALRGTVQHGVDLSTQTVLVHACTDDLLKKGVLVVGDRRQPDGPIGIGVGLANQARLVQKGSESDMVVSCSGK